MRGGLSRVRRLGRADPPNRPRSQRQSIYAATVGHVRRATVRSPQRYDCSNATAYQRLEEQFQRTVREACQRR